MKMVSSSMFQVFTHADGLRWHVVLDALRRTSQYLQIIADLGEQGQIATIGESAVIRSGAMT